MRILAVDDDPLILDLLRTALETSGFGDVTFASSAEEAFEVLDRTQTPFDAFLLDILLYETNGIELCRQIRGRKEYRATPIIMMTSSRAHDMMARAFAAGATDFVQKPFDGLELGTRVNMAAMLSESLRREQIARHEMTELSRRSAISFDEPFTLGSANGAQPLLALENNLLRKGDALYAMTLFCVRIDEAVALYRSTTPAQFREIVEGFGAALSCAIDTDTIRFAHAGRGVIVAVAYRRERLNLTEMMAGLQQALDENWDAHATGLEANVPFTVEQMGHQRLWSGKSAATALRGVHGQADLRAQSDPDEVDNLFTKLSKRIKAR